MVQLLPPRGYFLQTACHGWLLLVRPDADVMNNVWEFALFLNTACAKVFS